MYTINKKKANGRRLACVRRVREAPGKLLSTRDAKGAFRYRLLRLLRFPCAWQPHVFIHNSMDNHEPIVNWTKKKKINKKKTTTTSTQLEE